MISLPLAYTAAMILIALVVYLSPYPSNTPVIQQYFGDSNNNNRRWSIIVNDMFVKLETAFGQIWQSYFIVKLDLAFVAEQSQLFNLIFWC